MNLSGIYNLGTITDAQSKFGTKSMFFNTNWQYLTLFFDGITSYFTADFFFRTSYVANDGVYYPFCAFNLCNPLLPASTTQYRYQVACPMYALRLYNSKVVVFNSNGSTVITSSNSIASNTWYHFSLYVNPPRVFFVLNGTISSIYDDTTYGRSPLVNPFLSFGNTIGVNYSVGLYIDALRVGNNLVQYIPSSAPVPDNYADYFVCNFESSGVVNEVSSDVSSSGGVASTIDCQSEEDRIKLGRSIASALNQFYSDAVYVDSEGNPDFSKMWGFRPSEGLPDFVLWATEEMKFLNARFGSNI